MAEPPGKFEDYFSHLKQISFAGRFYKKFFSSPILFFLARQFGNRVIEIGSGTGSGVLGSFPKCVRGLEINPHAVEFCKASGFNVKLIGNDGNFPMMDGTCDVCILDNVLEHIEDPHKTLDECCRITRKNGGLIVVVPGIHGYCTDDDHKKFYDADALKQLDERWKMQNLFSIPFLFRSERLSKSVRQYCLVATYKKN